MFSKKRSLHVSSSRSLVRNDPMVSEWGRPVNAEPPNAPKSEQVGYGTLQLLPGYQHKEGNGIDTHAGRIWKKDGMEIHYDIGPLAGNYAKREKEKKDGKLLWHKEQTVGTRKMDVSLTKDRVLFVTLDGPVNFYATVKSDEDMADLLLMIASYSDLLTKK
jgi:hypothetical protein